MDELNIKDTMSIINYGVNIQNMMSDLSECATGIVRNIELKDINDLLSDMLHFFKTDVKGNMTVTEKERQIDIMSDKLKGQRVGLLKDCEMLEQLCLVNRQYISEISALIEHAKEVMENEKQNPLSADDKMRLSTLEKRIRELEMSQTVAYSFEPQLKVVQENEAQMAEKIQSALVNALSLWKRQQASVQNKESAEDTNALIMEGINELIRMQREGYSLVDKS